MGTKTHVMRNFSRLLLASALFGLTRPASAQEGDSKKEETCHFLMTRYVAPAREFLKKFSHIEPTKDSYVKHAALDPKLSCNKGNRANIIKTLVESINKNSGKIGVILPLSGDLANYGKNILLGIQAALQDKQVNPEDVLVIRDNAGEASQDESIFADLVLRRNIAMVIGGFQSAAASNLEYWSERLAVPTLLLSMNANSTQKNRYSFRVFPHPDPLIDALAVEAKAQGLHRIAILSPANSGGLLMANAGSRVFKAAGLQITDQETYTTGNYESMEAASKKLFKVQPSQRESEYRRLVTSQRARAKKEGFAFNPKMIVLPPQIDFDALFIPDNFKQVRHLVQIFKYLGVKKLPLMGHYEWRSEGLLKPSDPFLTGSFFADFIGSYQELPNALAPPKVNGYFAKSDELESLDFRIIGWRAGDLSTDALKDTAKRNAITTKLQSLEERGKAYFGSGKAFANNRSRWPASVFAIGEQQLTLRQTRPINNVVVPPTP